MGALRKHKDSRKERPADSKATDRLEARITGDQKRFFQRAAQVRGLTLTDFVISSLHAAAADAVREHDTIVLGTAARAAFIDLVANPPVPNEALRRAVARHRQVVEKT
jgi:uncharacterized protein (DUF1778 family)